MSQTLSDTAFALDERSLARYRRRQMFSRIGWIICGICFVLLGAALVDILVQIAVGGFSALDGKLFTTTTQGRSGGLLNAIEGTAVLTIGSVAIAGPLGIGVGVYCSEKRHHHFSKVVRFMGDVLVGIPSIVLGLFGYITMVIALGWHFSALAGALTLAVMIIPYIARTTELALVSLPGSLRESAYSLGASEASVILRVLIPSANGRILTGLLLAMSLSMGETAPLIYTVGWSNYTWDGNLTHEPMAYLTYVIWSFINEPFESAHKLAFAAALLITFFALAITLSSRLILRYIEKGR